MTKLLFLKKVKNVAIYIYIYIYITTLKGGLDTVASVPVSTIVIPA